MSELANSNFGGQTYSNFLPTVPTGSVVAEFRKKKELERQSIVLPPPDKSKLIESEVKTEVKSEEVKPKLEEVKPIPANVGFFQKPIGKVTGIVVLVALAYAGYVIVNKK